jgi:hypothetical protein
MGFLSKVFKKKKGGTLFGNLIRGVANTASGGILGNGAQMLKDSPADKVILPVSQNPTYVGGQNIGQTVNEQIQQIPQVQSIQNSVQMQWVKKNWYLLAMPVLLILYLLFQNSKLKTKTK